MMTLFVSNIHFEAEDQDLRELFLDAGYIPSRLRIVQESGRSRGFAFVDLVDQEAGAAAIADLNGQDFRGRRLSVREARPQAEHNEWKARRRAS